MNGKEFDWQSRINIDPVIKGRRVLIEVIVGALAASDSIDEICEGYLLTEDDVRAALAYAAYVLADDAVHALPG